MDLMITKKVIKDSKSIIVYAYLTLNSATALNRLRLLLTSPIIVRRGSC
jgi:hypothetical protein